MNNGNRKKELKPEDIVRLTTELGRLGRWVIDRSLDDNDPLVKTSEGSLRNIAGILRSIAFDEQIVVQNITRGFALANGDFSQLSDLFDVLREDYGLPEEFAPQLCLINSSTSPRQELGFIIRNYADNRSDSKIVPRNKGDKLAETAIETLFAVVRERRERRQKRDAANN
jgi:hypothetical protein